MHDPYIARVLQSVLGLLRGEMRKGGEGVREGGGLNSTIYRTTLSGHLYLKATSLNNIPLPNPNTPHTQQPYIYNGIPNIRTH